MLARKNSLQYTGLLESGLNVSVKKLKLKEMVCLLYNKTIYCLIIYYPNHLIKRKIIRSYQRMMWN